MTKAKQAPQAPEVEVNTAADGAEPNLTVVNLGDATERDVVAAPTELIAIQKMAALPKGFETVREVHAAARGWSQEGANVVVHY